MLDGTNKIFHSNFMKDFGSFLNINSDFKEISSGNGKVYIAESVITSAFYLFVETLGLVFKKNNAGTPLNYQSFFIFYDNLLKTSQKKIKEPANFDFLEAALKGKAEKMDLKEIKRIHDKNLVGLCQKLNISVKEGGKKISHADLAEKLAIYQDNLSSEECKTRTLLKEFETEEEREKREISSISKTELETIGKRLKIVTVGTKEQLWNRVKAGLLAEKLSVNDGDTRLLQMFAFVKVFASNCVFFMRAIRTNNFELRFAILKLSLRLFQQAGADYYDLVVQHLFHFHNFFPPAYKQLMRECWTVPSKTRSTFKALDEDHENLNLDLKNSLGKTTIPAIRQASNIISAQKRLHLRFKELFGDHSMNFGKSRNLNQDLVSVLKERVQNSDMILYNFASIWEFGNFLSEEEKKSLVQKAISELHSDFVAANK